MRKSTLFGDGGIQYFLERASRGIPNFLYRSSGYSAETLKRRVKMNICAVDEFHLLVRSLNALLLLYPICDLSPPAPLVTEDQRGFCELVSSANWRNAIVVRLAQKRRCWHRTTVIITRAGTS